jgi:DNA-binding Lrp family transcriptional regulator
MLPMLTEMEITIIRYLQGDIPLNSRPFAELAQQLGISEEETVDHIEDLKNRGLLRDWQAYCVIRKPALR